MQIHFDRRCCASVVWVLNYDLLGCSAWLAACRSCHVQAKGPVVLFFVKQMEMILTQSGLQ